MYFAEPVRMCYNGVFGNDTGGEENQEIRINVRESRNKNQETRRRWGRGLIS
jgi:hypothetical protein